MSRLRPTAQDRAQELVHHEIVRSCNLGDVPPLVRTDLYQMVAGLLAKQDAVLNEVDAISELLWQMGNDAHPHVGAISARVKRILEII